MSLRVGSRGAGVEAVQSRLNAEGAHVAVDGRYGRETRAAVIEFQREHRLRRIDGIVGPETARAMGLRDGFDAAPPARRSRSGSSGDGMDAPRRAEGRSEDRAEGSRRSRSVERAPEAEPARPLRSAADLLAPEERELTAIQQTTLAANRLSARLEAHTRRGEPVPADEAAVAHRLLDGMERVSIPLAEDPELQFNDFSVARGRLRSAVEASER